MPVNMLLLKDIGHSKARIVPGLFIFVLGRCRIAAKLALYLGYGYKRMSWTFLLLKNEVSSWHGSRAKIPALRSGYAPCCMRWDIVFVCIERTCRALPTLFCRSTEPLFSFMAAFGTNIQVVNGLPFRHQMKNFGKRSWLPIKEETPLSKRN